MSQNRILKECAWGNKRNTQQRIMNWFSTLLVCYSLSVGIVLAIKEGQCNRRLSRHNPGVSSAIIPQVITGKGDAVSEVSPQGLHASKRVLTIQETDFIPPEAPRLWPFAYASYFFNNTDHIDTLPDEPLTFSNVLSQNVTYTATRLIVQIEGLYQASVVVNNYLLNSTVIAHVWQNGIQIPDSAFIIEVGTPLGVVDSINVPAKVNDYFELVVDVPGLIGLPGQIAYSLAILKIS